MKNNIYNDFDFDSDGESDDYSYPDFFLRWDDAVNSGKKQGFFEPEELTEIVETYIINNQIERANQAIDYALRIFHDDDELLYDILLVLYDYERWNELLAICKKYKEDSNVWMDGHHLTALLHLGMEEESFSLFKKLKIKHADDNESLSILYQAMGEALFDSDLFDSAIPVVQEAIDTLEVDANFYWIQLQSNVFLENKEAVAELADVILKLNPLDVDTWRRLGFFFTDIDDKEKAIEALEYARSLGDNSEEVLMYLIHVYDTNKNYNKALEKAMEYLNIYPDNHIINLTAAKLSSIMGNWKGAIQYVDKTLKLAPHVELLYLYKCNCLLKLDEYKKAKLILIDGLKNTKDLGGNISKRLSELNEEYPDY